ncbi:MAG: YkvA family protein [Chthoniobacterales bacterium]
MGKTKGSKPSKQRTAARRPSKPKAMANAKKTLTSRPRPEKAAIRSAAFAKAILDAKSYAADAASLRTLFTEASTKAASIPRSALEGLGPYLQAMLRLLRAYAGGDYRKISKDALLTIVAAISYLVDPFDLIPDEIPFLGYVDDATVIRFAVSRTRDALDAFMLWETSADS